jgi:glycosyltransferase involved in cell wall biosynthesis
MEQDDSIEITCQQENGSVPSVTVVISLYNYRDYIWSCLESVRTQTISKLDLIVVDDCSTDAGAETVQEWLRGNGSRFNRYLLVRHSTNRGLSAARNSGFARARTEYVFVLDVDNLLYPRCLETLTVALERCHASFAYCYLEKFGGARALQNLRPWDATKLHSGNSIDAMVLLRRSVWEAVGGYSTDMNLGWEDYELWFKIAKSQGWGILIPEILGRYRVHFASMLVTTTNPNAAKLWTYLRSKYPEFFA